MPPATWTLPERRDLLYMLTEYNLADEQLHDLMGRIYGDVWRNDPQRKQYTIKDIRDGKHSFSLCEYSFVDASQRSSRDGRQAAALPTTKSLILRAVSTTQQRQQLVRSLTSASLLLQDSLEETIGFARMRMAC